MSDNPRDDGFADLFAKLPDPKDRDSAAAAAPEQPAETAAPPAESPPAPVPTSRRAAREAATRGATGSTPTSASATPPPADAPRASATSASASPRDERSRPASSPSAGSERAVPSAVASSPRSDRASRRGGDASPSTPASMTLDELFDGTDDHHDTVVKPRRRRRIAGWIALGVVLLMLGGIAGASLWVWSTYEEQIRAVMGWEEPKDFEEGLAHGEALITISAGDTGSPISQTLYDAGVTKTPEAFYDYLIDSGQNPNFQPGVYRLQLQMTSPAALEAIMDPANKLENSAVIPEGLTVDQTLPLLAEGLDLPLEDFETAVGDPSAFGVDEDSLEGWLFPAMYTFDPGITADGVIQTMVDRAIQSLDAAGVPVEDREEILTIASIIQREARFEDDFYKVSRVIQNRLDPSNQETFGLLQMDSTAQYGYGELHDGTVSSSEEALTDDNPWNTYVHPGLPVGPIANPGDLAIDAAMHPADGPWLYFVTVNLDTGETVFTNNLSEHNAAVRQWQQWCADNPDGGC